MTAPQLYDLDVERMILGSMIFDGHQREHCLRGLLADDFYSPANQAMFDLIERMHLTGAAVTATTVAIEAERVPVLRPYHVTTNVRDLLVQHGMSVFTGEPARLVDLAARRRAVAIGADLAAAARDPATDFVDALNEAQDRIASVAIPTSGAKTTNLGDWLAGPMDYDWLVPDRIARQDRILIVARPGAGKSELLRQMAVTMSQGVDPFADGPAYPPCRALLVDLENGPVLIRRRLRFYDRVARDRCGAGYDPSRLAVESRPSGLNLAARADVGWLIDRVIDFRPDVLVIGPVYKLSGHDDNDGSQVAKVLALLDSLRARYGLTLILETHPPHGDVLRPSGSKLWIQWPEAVFGLSEAKDAGVGVFDFVRVRPHRAGWDVTWPAQVRHAGTWPWQGVA